MKRDRLLYSVLIVCIIVAGLVTRRYGRLLPEIVAEYGGDTLWALMVFVSLGFVAREWPTHRVAAVSLTISYAVEFSQLYHAEWLDQFRHNTVGGLVLGRGFLWSDLVCYAVGVGLGAAFEVFLGQRLRSGVERVASGESSCADAGRDNAD